MKKLLFSLLLCTSLVANTTTANNATSVAQKNKRSKQAILDTMQQEGIEFVSFVFSDLLGNQKELIIPAKFVPGALENGLCVDGSSIPGCTAITESDMLLVPDINTFTAVPWTEGEFRTARIICDLYLSENEAYKGDPRYLLKEVTKLAENMGYKFYVGPELEFFLFNKHDGSPCDNSGYFDVETNIDAHFNKRELLHALHKQGVYAEKLHQEVAPGQHEISIRYGEAVNIADQIVIAKNSIKTLANEWGLDATFMPKPIYGENGSGMHVHFSLYDTKNDCNAFYNANDSMMLSETAHKFIAGVLTYAKDFTAIFNPTINSYKRLVPGYEAPIYVCWGSKNRSTQIRIPRVNANQGYAVRAELRSADAMSNPYLIFSIMLMAGLEGIKQNLTIVPAIEENLYGLSIEEIHARNIKTLPTSLEESLKLLEQSAFAQSILGMELLGEFIKVKKKEVREFNRIVTRWEIEQYN